MVGQRALSFGGAAVYMHLHETCDVCRSCRAPLRPHCIDARQPRYRLFVDSWGAWKTSVLFTALMLTGVTGWAVSAGIYPLMAISVAIWGAGLCFHQFDAAGAAGRHGTCARLRLGVAQHVGALHRAGRRIGDRRLSVRAGSHLGLRPRLGGVYRVGARDGDPDQAKESSGRVA